MGLSTNGLNKAATDFAAAWPWLSLHDVATPDDTGSGETTAARMSAGWSTSAGAATASNKAFTGGASNGAVLAVGYWDAQIAGNFGGYESIPTGGTDDLTFNAAGEYTANITVTDANGS